MTRKEAIKELKIQFVGEYDRQREAKDIAIKALEQGSREGRWTDIHRHHYYDDGDIETTELMCSCCNKIVEWDIELLHKPFFCENCGADMREEIEE